jgi:hypothetical protein
MSPWTAGDGEETALESEQKKRNMPYIKHVLTIVTLYTQFTIRPTTRHRATACPAITPGGVFSLSGDIESHTTRKQSRVGATFSESIHYIKVLSLASVWHFLMFWSLTDVGEHI